MHRKRLLIIGPGPEAQGGISAVISNYQASNFWNEFHCEWFASNTEPLSGFASMWFQIGQFLKYIATLAINRPYAVSIHTASRNSFYRKFFYISFAWCFRIPVILHVHPAYFFQFFSSGNIVRRGMVRAAVSMSDRVVFLTEELRERFQTVFPRKLLSVVPNPVDTTTFEFSERPPAHGNLSVLFLGWIVEEKGVYDIVEAIPAVREQFPDVQFLFAGNKEVEILRERIARAGLQTNARVLGWVAGREKRDLLINSRLLILPSYTEGVPNVLLEAMAAGLPAITTPVGGIPSIFREDVNGRFVNPRDPAALAARIIEFLADDDYCDRISATTRQEAIENFDVNIIGKHLASLYKSYLID